jgi:hypothetical protein
MSNILTNNINPRSGNVINIGGVNDKVSIAGTLTYEDVTSVDSIGVVTARSGLNVVGGGITAVGVITSYSGIHVGAGVSAVGIITAQSGVEFGTVGSGVTISAVGAGTSLGFLVNGSERVRIDNSGRFGIGAATVDAPFHVKSGSSNGAVIAKIEGETGDYFQFGISGTQSYLGTFHNSPLSFWTNNLEHARIDSSGRLLVGTSTDTTARLVVKGSAGSGDDGINVISGSTTVGSKAAIFFTPSTTGSFSTGSAIKTERLSPDGSDLQFYTCTALGNSPTERMRIDKDGHVLVGNSAITNKGTLNAYSNDSTPGLRCVAGSSMGLGSAILAVDKHANVNTTSQVFMVFTINEQNTGSGQINANGASQAAFGNFSDRRLKENIVDIPSQLENICKLRPVEFDYIQSEGGGHQISFIAQEFEEVYPDAVGEREDGMKTLTGWGKTEAILVKALQEAIAKIETLETRLTALEGGAS